MLADFHLLRPWWLLSVLPYVAFLVWFARPRFAMMRWQGIVEPQLMPHVLVGMSDMMRTRVTVALTLSGLLLVLALSGPAWTRLPQPVYRSQNSLVIALDLSRSMDITDVNPSRLDRARYKINDILERRGEGQTALLVYAAEPYVISPLTDDVRTIASQLPALSTELMPNQGSRADRALRKAAELLQQTGAAAGHVLLITDGVNAERAQSAAAELRKENIRISVLGIGTAEGGPIPTKGGFMKNRSGSIVIEKISAAELSTLASQGGGTFQPLSPTAADIERLLADIDTNAGDMLESDFEVDVWRDEGPWLLLPLLPLAALAFRRGVLVIWLLALLLPIQRADAFDWSDLWSDSDQRAIRILESGDAATAAQMFADPAWKGAAKYKAGRYAESLTALEDLTDITSTYNRGNVYAMLDRYDKAIETYDEVLAQDPDHADARFNRELVSTFQQQQRQMQAMPADSDQRAGGPPPAADDNTPRPPPGQGDPTPESEQEEFGEAASSDRVADEPGTEPGDGSQDDQNAQQQEDFPDNQATRAIAVADAGQATDIDDSDVLPDMADNMTPDEKSQATEQWLRKIPDDPGGLLRRKFYYQYQQQTNLQQENEKW